MLTVDISGGRSADGEQILISFWPSAAGLLPGGGFDVDAWEAAQTHLVPAPGANAREAFYEAYRTARLVAREHGGLEFLDLCIDEEPCPFPDLKREDALRAPAVVRIDNGKAFQSRTSGELRQVRTVR